MLESIHDNLKCPKCRGYLEEGAVAINQGLRWKRMKGLDLSEMSEHLPNTHAVARPNHLVAYRCRRCELVVLDYGRTLERQPQFADQVAAVEGNAAQGRSTDQGQPRRAGDVPLAETS